MVKRMREREKNSCMDALGRQRNVMDVYYSLGIVEHAGHMCYLSCSIERTNIMTFSSIHLKKRQKQDSLSSL